MNNLADTYIKNTKLWQSAFQGTDGDVGDDIRHFYETQLLSLRKKIGVLLDRIKVDMPDLTVHDLTHLDALWEYGSLVAGKNCKLTTAEGFVFGCAVLLHDAAMSLVAYKDGLDGLKETSEWRDTVSMAIRVSLKRPPELSEISNPPSDILKFAIPQVLRSLHAKQAAELPSRCWESAAGHQEFLIENSDLRIFYGSMIGSIARSHGEPISYIEASLREVLGSCSTLDGGSVDGLKLACLLRCADAAHIDARRAPIFAEAVLKPEGIAGVHWTFQGRVAKPRLVDKAIVYSAASPFSLKEADAWWLCFDAVRAVDKELRSCDSFLEVSGRAPFAAQHARGAESPKALVRDVPTQGWDPVDAHVKVSNVKRLVKMFGGETLYGENSTVVIRELLQNAADAVRARRRLSMPTDAYEGEIKVGLFDDDEGTWFVISDDGLGMSSRTITDTLLDFGNSFWSTESVQKEFPGLMSSGFAPTGKYGIGFFSVFMVADVVRVISRRFDAAQTQTKTLEFRGGLELRPILRDAAADEMTGTTGGTTIKLKLKKPPYEEGGLLYREDAFGHAETIHLGILAAHLCPNLDVTVSLGLRRKRDLVLKSEDWKRITGVRYLSRVHGADLIGHDEIFAKLLRPLKAEGRTIGRACIRPDTHWRKRGRAVVRGFSVRELEYIEGTLNGEVENLARDKAKVTIPPAALRAWANEQAKLISTALLPEEQKLTAAGVVIGCGGDPQDLPICRFHGKYLSKTVLLKALRRVGFSELLIHEGELDFEDEDDCHPREFSDFIANDNVILLGQLRGAAYTKYWWPNNESYWPSLAEVLNSHWKKWIEVEGDYFSRSQIGKVDVHPIKRRVRMVKKLTL